MDVLYLIETDHSYSYYGARDTGDILKVICLKFKVTDNFSVGDVPINDFPSMISYSYPAVFVRFIVFSRRWI